MEYEDIEILCIECKGVFTLAAGEQKFYDCNDLIQPKRCRLCRSIRKEQDNEEKQPKRVRTHRPLQLKGSSGNILDH